MEKQIDRLPEKIQNNNIFQLIYIIFLYTYNAVDNLPKGVIIKDGNEVWIKVRYFLILVAKEKEVFLPFQTFL